MLILGLLPLKKTVSFAGDLTRKKELSKLSKLNLVFYVFTVMFDDLLTQNFKIVATKSCFGARIIVKVRCYLFPTCLGIEKFTPRADVAFVPY